MKDELILNQPYPAEPPRVNEHLAGPGDPTPFNYFKQKIVSLPDAGERTKNDPTYLMSSDGVLKLIKSYYKPDWPVYDKLGNVTPLMDCNKEAIKPELINLVIKLAIEKGWSEVKLIGKQLLFISSLVES